MKKQTDTFKRLRAVMKDINGDNRQIIKTIQNQIEYLIEFIDIQGEILKEKTGSRQPELSVEQKSGIFYRFKLLRGILRNFASGVVFPVCGAILKKVLGSVILRINEFWHPPI